MTTTAAPLDVHAGPKTETAPETERPRPKSRRAFLVLGIVVGVMLLGVLVYVVATHGKESTDDAQVQADAVPVAARVGGTVLKVLVKENDHVTAGQLLLQLDDAEYVAREQQAEGELEEAKAQEEQAEAQEQIVMASAKGGFSSARAFVVGSAAREASADAQIAAARAAVQRAEAEAANADTTLRRDENLSADNAIPQQQLDNARLADQTAHAAVEQARADLKAAEETKRAATLGVAEAQGRFLQSRPVDAQIAAAHGAAALARGKVTAAQAALDLAKLQLSYTHVTAPADGRVSNLTARVAQILAAGQPFAQFVPDVGYVTANFKETQTGDMHPGQRAKISLDAYPHRSFEGHVESLSAGTGAEFSLLPPNNATGNFVKVVQRVPVRVAFDNPPKDVVLRAGLSADVTVYVK